MGIIICDHAPRLCHQTHFCAPPRPNFYQARHGEQNMYSGGSRSEFGGTGGARGHILCPSKVTQIDTGFGQSCQKRSKGGTPLFYRFFSKLAGTLDPPPLVWALGGRFWPRGSIPLGPKTALRAEISRWEKCPQALKNRVF